jgi:hypothetical protein
MSSSLKRVPQLTSGLPLPLGEGWGEGSVFEIHATGGTLTLTLSQWERGPTMRLVTL